MNPEQCDPESEAMDLIEMFARGLHRRVMEDRELIDTVRTTIASVGPAKFTSDGDYWKFREMMQYSSPSPTLGTGDIFKTTDGRMLVLISPQCDLVDPGEDVFCCVEAIPTATFLGDTSIKAETKRSVLHNRVPKYHVLHSINPDRDMVLDFTKVINVLKTTLKSDYNRVYAIASPFREQVIQRYVSFVNRIGTPDIPDKIMKKYINSRLGDSDDTDQ